MRLGDAADGEDAGAPGSGRRSKAERSIRERRLGRVARPYLYLMPAFVVLGVFVYWPVLLVSALSLVEWNLIGPNVVFVGLENFASLLTSGDFLLLLLRSVLYVLAALLGNFLLPVGLAMLTMQVRQRHSDLYQSLLFTPTVVATSVGALLWQFIYLPTGSGLLNASLETLGLSGTDWLGNSGTALPAVATVAAWQYMGFNYLVALAGIMAVPKDYLEAARVDGATGWPMLRHVMVPLLMPTILFLMVTTVLQALPNAFVPIEILTGGGPNGASNNLLYDVYRTGLRYFQVGEASAEAVLLMALLGGAAVWQFRMLDRSLTYDR